MRLLRKVWQLLDEAAIDLRVQYIRSEDNSLADALSRGAPHDELVLDGSTFRSLQRRWGPHSVDAFASESNAQLPRYFAQLPTPGAIGANALAQPWASENVYAFPPLSVLPQVAQLVASQRAVRATLVVPYWPAQAWFQMLADAAVHVELWPAHRIASMPLALHASARHVLSGETLAIIRVEARPEASI
jgi:hypothetical protein